MEITLQESLIRFIPQQQVYDGQISGCRGNVKAGSAVGITAVH
jgi:hypothetical protein